MSDPQDQSQTAVDETVMTAPRQRAVDRFFAKLLNADAYLAWRTQLVDQLINGLQKSQGFIDWLAGKVNALVREEVAEMLGINDPSNARSVVQTLVNEAVDKATEPLLVRIKQLEQGGRSNGPVASAHPSGPAPLVSQRDPDTVRNEIIPAIVVSVMNDRDLGDLSPEDADALRIDRDYVSPEFAQRIWDREILRDLWGQDEGLRERRMEAVAEFIDAEMTAMTAALKRNLKRSKTAQDKANMAWAQYFLVRLGVDPADAKAVKTAMGRQKELKAYLK